MSREAHAQGRAICVVGGGIAGTVGALRLAADGHRVRLLAGSAALPPAGDDEIVLDGPSGPTSEVRR